MALIPPWSHITSNTESDSTVAMARLSVTLNSLVAWHIRSIFKRIARTLRIVVKVASTATLVYEDLARFERCP